MIEQISLLTVDLIGHISCLLLCTALFRRTCAKRQLVLAFLGTLAAGYLITVVPVIREFPIKAILLVMVFTVFCHACYEGKILTQCLCAVFSYVIMLALDTAAIFLFCNWVGMPREQIFADPQLYMICALLSLWFLLPFGDLRSHGQKLRKFQYPAFWLCWFFRWCH